MKTLAGPLGSQVRKAARRKESQPEASVDLYPLIIPLPFANRTIVEKIFSVYTWTVMFAADRILPGSRDDSGRAGAGPGPCRGRGRACERLDHVAAATGLEPADVAQERARDSGQATTVHPELELRSPPNQSAYAYTSVLLKAGHFDEAEALRHRVDRGGRGAPGP